MSESVSITPSAPAPAASTFTPTEKAAPAAKPAPKPPPMIDQASEMSLGSKLQAAKEPKKTEAPPAKDEASAGGAATPGTEEEKKVASAPQKFKVKVDGKEMELTAEELTRDYQVRTVSQKRMQEAAELKKKVDAVLGVLVSDTGAALKAAGMTDEQIETFAIQLVARKQQEYLEAERMKNASPEEKELIRLRKMEREFQEHQKKLAEQQREQAIQERQTKVSRYVIAALEELPEGLKRNDFVASRALDAVEYAYNNYQQLVDQGYDVTPKGIARALQKELEGLGLSVAQLQKKGQPGTAKAIEQAAKGPNATPGTPVSRAAKDRAAKGEDRPRLSTAQLLRQITLGER